MEMNKKASIRYSFISTIPVMAGYVVMGMAFGILLNSKGYSCWWALLIACTVYCGSMQFVGVELLASGASIITTAIMTFLVNARHLFYGISMVDKYRELGWKKIYPIFTLTDETYSLVCDPNLPPNVDRKTYYLCVSAFNQCYWIVGCFAGALLGSALKFDTTGVDFAMTALFVVIVVEQWEKAKTKIPAIIGAVSALICLLIFGPDNFLIPTMVCIPIGLFALKKHIEKKEAEE